MTKANDDAAEALGRTIRERDEEPARTLSGYAIAKIREALKLADAALADAANSKLPHYQRTKAREARVAVQSSWAEVAPKATPDRHAAAARSFVSEHGTELCVLCGHDTRVKTDTPITQRVGYVEGSGQCCLRCARQ